MNAPFKAALRRFFYRCGFDIRRIYPIRLTGLPDRDFYAPVFSPWLGYGDFQRFRSLAEPYSIVFPASLYTLYSLALNATRLSGEFWECGVYKGGTGRMLAAILHEHAAPTVKLRLFDTFEGMPESDAARDIYRKGEYADTSVEAVRAVVGHRERTTLHPGWIPDTFAGLEDARIALAHVDVVLYKAVLDCCAFLYPRLTPGGILLFDDYGIATCPGTRAAVDEFFADKPEFPLVLPTGQALVVKLPA